MARVTVEDCIRYYPNRFEMVLLAARRARQIQSGMPVLIELESEDDKPAVQALREMGDGFVSWDALYEQDDQQSRRQSAFNADEENAG